MTNALNQSMWEGTEEWVGNGRQKARNSLNNSEKKLLRNQKLKNLVRNECEILCNFKFQ